MLRICIVSTFVWVPPGPYSSMDISSMYVLLQKAQCALLIQDKNISAALEIYAYAAVLQTGLDHDSGTSDCTMCRLHIIYS